MTYLHEIGKNAKIASKQLSNMTTCEKNEILKIASDAIINSIDYFTDENKKDVTAAIEAVMNKSFVDRLILNDSRIKNMADGLNQVAALNDPVGKIYEMQTLKNGLIVGKKTVPLGVVCIIYESRPNVTADAFGLCLKSGNSVILRGGKESINSNIAIVNSIKRALFKYNINHGILQLIESTDRETVSSLMNLNEYIDVLIPRGGAGLINSVVKNSTIPVIQTGIGNCHIYVDEYADLEMAKNIIINAKTSRPGVCNACEKLLIHKKIAHEFLPLITKLLKEKNVEIHGDKISARIVNDIIPIKEEEWQEEYLDYTVGIKIVEDIDDAIEHIGNYSSSHSEAIITESYSNSQKFLNQVDSAAVYINASTRFTDGNEFGLGCEIGISTQKLHARGPMGLDALTSYKHIIYGNGQIREK